MKLNVLEMRKGMRFDLPEFLNNKESRMNCFFDKLRYFLPISDCL